MIGDLLVSVARPSLRYWEWAAMLGLAGLIVLNYGFANLSLPTIGVRLPVPHLLLGLALGLAVLERPEHLRSFFKKPLVIAWLLMLALSLVHLIIDIPKYGAWALRDVSFVVEMGSLLLGYLWVKRDGHGRSLMMGLAIIFLINLGYSFTYPFREFIIAQSPTSGIFRDQIPIVGSYAHTPLILIAGALFYLLVAPQFIKLPKPLLLVLATIMAGWSFVFQVRTVYLGILVSIALVLLFGGLRKAVLSTVVLVGGGILLLLFLIFSGIPLQGRSGPVNPKFMAQHVTSLLPFPLAISPSDKVTARGQDDTGLTSGIETEASSPFDNYLNEKAAGTGQDDAGLTLVPEPVAPVTGIALEDTGAEVGSESTGWRIERWSETLRRWLNSPARVLVGEGFGEPLVNAGTFEGIAVRQPHNTHLTVLARLGLVGIGLWVFIHSAIVVGFVKALKTFPRHHVIHNMHLWLFLFYALGMLFTTFQPWLEFSYGAIPFFILIGFHLGWRSKAE